MICMLRKRVTVSTILVLMCVFPYENPTNNSETKYKHFLEWKNIMSMFNFFANKCSFENFYNGSYPDTFTWKLPDNNKIVNWLNA
jgi:hypothetical protein